MLSRGGSGPLSDGNTNTGMSKNTQTIGAILLTVFALVGIATMGYLLSLHYSSGEGAFCNLGEGLSCEVVNKSVYSEVFGIPVSLFGLLYFAAIFLLVLFRREKLPHTAVVLGTVILLGPSLYLTGVEIFVLKSICVFCELGKLLMVAIAVTAYWMSPKHERPTAVHFIIVALLGAFLGFATYYVHKGIVPAGKYAAFAQCIYDDGMRMYGARTCSFCAKQRALFGDATPYIREIECDPREPNNETDRCIAKGIERTPTWIREDGAGNTLKKFDPGVLSLETLAAETGCVLP